MKNILSNRYALIITTLIIGVIVGWVFNSFTHQPITTSSHQSINTSEVWTCSMHPSVRQSEPGKCPICGMDLIPLGDDGGEDIEGLQMSETAMKLANIQTTIVGVGNQQKEIRLNGKVVVDERKRSSQSAHIPGRIEQLLVNFTGEFVSKGQTIAQIYSPELVTAQQELFEAQKIKDDQPVLFNAAKEKLKNWKLTDKQIESILASGKPQERFPLIADVSGIVMDRKVNVGDYVMRGAPIYDVTDLSSVWVLFDVYESDLPWIKKNDLIEFTVQSLPGEVFKQRISFIDPVLNSTTRVTTARVELSNPGMKLKPEMFTSGVVKSGTASNKDLTIPKSAVMWTGERSIVYIKKTNDNGVSFQLQEVVLGPSLGDAYVVKEGLSSGTEIVTNGTFTIDAAAQLAGKPSMMNTEGGAAMTGHSHGESKPASSDHSGHQMGSATEVHEDFKKQLNNLLAPYLTMKDAFVKTNAAEAAKGADAFSSSLQKVDMKLLKGDTHTAWMQILEPLQSATVAIAKGTDVESQRSSFSTLSDNYVNAIQLFGVSGLDAYYQFCPMAFNNKGAYWISKEKQISNPYFGDKMLRCGVTKSELD
ncbi:MAG TPA: efflux RND transporter periplasmic adaptor subunit [Cyclobacteriaceae bacterium]|nr:efflux RND transporter periplasmic adaptor subunit [Cyclobacteriaceae bacterium]